MKASGQRLRGNPCSFYFLVLTFFFWWGRGRRIFFLVGRGWGGGENILTYLFKYCRGFTCLASASGEPLLKLFFLGGGGGRGDEQEFFLDGGWKNIQTYF